MPAPYEIWGNGADFDNPILEAAYDLLKMPAPWKYNEGRCYRTLKSLFPTVVAIPQAANAKHNALLDAKNQAEHASRILKFIANQPVRAYE